MEIYGFQKISLIDYPGQVAATVFTGGCNFKCKFCYNSDLVQRTCGVQRIAETEVMKEIKKREKMLDGVVLCGGEPTIQVDIVDFAKKIKSMGLLVKLDTNGSNPEVVEELIKNKLVDYIAMDIKAPFNEYINIVGVQVDVEKLRKTINLVMNSGLDYEFITTVLRRFHNTESVKRMASCIAGGRKYFLQLFRPEDKIMDPVLKEDRAFTKEELDEMVEAAREFLPADLRI